LRAVSEPASNIEYARAFGVMVPGKRLIAVLRQTIDQQMLETTELVEQDGIPRRDDDVVFPSHANAPIEGSITSSGEYHVASATPCLK
jgi:hypothetical protein